MSSAISQRILSFSAANAFVVSNVQTERTRRDLRRMGKRMKCTNWGTHQILQPTERTNVAAARFSFMPQSMPVLSCMPRVVIAGCGFVGLQTARLFHAAGWSVLGCTHSPESAAALSGEAFP